MRLNTERGRVVDFVIQYETPVTEFAALHYEVVRFDGSHGRAHYHVFNRQGQEVRRRWLLDHLTYNQAVPFALAHIEHNWREYHATFFGEDA